MRSQEALALEEGPFFNLAPPPENFRPVRTTLDSAPRAVASEAFKGLMDGASLATARGTESSTQVEIFSAKTSDDPISLTPSVTNSKAHTKIPASRCQSKPLVVCAYPIASTVESEKRLLA